MGWDALRVWFKDLFGSCTWRNVSWSLESRTKVSGIFLTRSAHCSWHGVSWCHMFLSTLAGIDWRDLVEPLILGVFGALSLCSVGKSGDIWWLMVTSRPYVRRLQDLIVPYTQFVSQDGSMVQCHSDFPTPARRLQEWIHELGLGLGYCDLDCIPHVGCTLDVKNARVGLDWMREVSYSSVLPFYSVYQGGYFFICQQIGVGFKRPWLKIGVPKGTAKLVMPSISIGGAI